MVRKALAPQTGENTGIPTALKADCQKFPVTPCHPLALKRRMVLCSLEVNSNLKSGTSGHTSAVPAESSASAAGGDGSPRSRGGTGFKAAAISSTHT